MQPAPSALHAAPSHSILYSVTIPCLQVLNCTLPCSKASGGGVPVATDRRNAASPVISAQLLAFSSPRSCLGPTSGCTRQRHQRDWRCYPQAAGNSFQACAGVMCDVVHHCVLLRGQAWPPCLGRGSRNLPASDFDTSPTPCSACTYRQRVTNTSQPATLAHGTSLQCTAYKDAGWCKHAVITAAWPVTYPSSALERWP